MCIANKQSTVLISSKESVFREGSQICQETNCHTQVAKDLIMIEYSRTVKRMDIGIKTQEIESTPSRGGSANEIGLVA